MKKLNKLNIEDIDIFHKGLYEYDLHGDYEVDITRLSGIIRSLEETINIIIKRLNSLTIKEDVKR